MGYLGILAKFPTNFKVSDSMVSLPPFPLLTAGRKGENRCENPAARRSVTKLAVSGEQERESRDYNVEEEKDMKWMMLTRET